MPDVAGGYTPNIDDREFAKFRSTPDGRTAVAVTIVDASAGTTNYDSAEFSVANSTTDYNVATNQTAAFSRVLTASRMILRTDRNISIRLNSNTDPTITVQTVDSPFELTGVPITNLFITNNSGGSATIKLILI